LPALLAAGVLAGCGGGTPVPPSPDPYAARVGADRQAPAGLAGDRRRARHDAEGAALDESRGQPIGSIVPPESTQQQQSPPAPPGSSQL
jgi:hypothetical protein